MKPRVFVTTDIHDIKGAEYDDLESFAHLLWYSDCYEIVGVSASHPRGNVETIRKLVKAYAYDYAHGDKETGWSEMQDPKTIHGYQGQPKEASYKPISPGVRALIRASQEGPLYVLVWGACTDLAAALQSKRFKAENCKVHVIASWNRIQDEKSFALVYEKRKSFSEFIWNETTFRGVYWGAGTSGIYGTETFLNFLEQNGGRLGKRMVRRVRYCNKNAIVKMGDTCSVLWVINPKWAGTYPNGEDDPNPKHRLVAFNGARRVANQREAFMKDWLKKIRKLYG